MSHRTGEESCINLIFFPSPFPYPCSRSLFLRLDRQRTREVFASEFLHAVTAFYPGGVAAAAGVGYDPRAAGVMELRKRYQMEVRCCVVIYD